MATKKWVLDASHSDIQFKVKHLMITTVTGTFKEFTGAVETEDDDISSAKIEFSANVNSVSTNNEQRDAHLKNGDFFDADNFPRLSFISSRLEKVEGEEYKLYGTLTMRGVSKPVILDVDFGGIITDPWGNTRSGFTVTGKINRLDFGVSFSVASETGAVLLGHDVNITANVQFVAQAQNVAA
ncbi:MAG TPA: YceI family protein [Chitinophagaceae bacterium]|nr:YceI family protein [Chitinophagaceae bacterium]